MFLLSKWTLVILGALTLFSFNVHAICTSANRTASVNIPSGDIVLNNNQPYGPIGNVIDINISGTATSVTCSGGISTTKWNTYLTLNESMEVSNFSPTVFKTNLPGIGVKVWNVFKHPSNPHELILSNNLKYWYTHITASSMTASSYLTGMKMQFYVIGPVKPGKIQLPSPFVNAWFNSASTYSEGTNYNTLVIPTEINVVVPSCELQNQTVKMGKHEVNDFLTGSKTSREVPFSLAINNCSPSLQSVSYTLEPGPGVSVSGSGDEQHLTLKNYYSGASGVGLQILQASDDKPVIFNQKIKVNSGATVEPSYVINMKARYIKTSDIISGGAANSTMVVTLSYE